MALPTITSTSGFSSQSGIASLVAAINPQSLDTQVYFAWGTTPLFGGQSSGTTTVIDIGTGALDITVNNQVPGLIPGMTYYFQAVATNSSGTTTSASSLVVYASPFTQLLEASTSPWDDPQGAWRGYQAALATMIEPTYDIVADLGDPEQPQIATLAAQINEGDSVTSISVINLAQSLLLNTVLVLQTSTGPLFLTVAQDTNVGATTISVTYISVSDHNCPIGLPVQLGFVPGWSSLLHTEQCPDQFLPYLAQFNGTDIPVGLDAETARNKIREESNIHRGTASSIASAVTRNLSGTQFVVIQERLNPIGNTDPYWFMVIVRPGEVVSASTLTADVNASKPGGVLWTLIETDGWTISQMETSQATITALEGDFVTLRGLENDRPGT